MILPFPKTLILMKMSQYEIGEINRSSRSSHLVPHAEAVLEEQEKGRTEDAEMGSSLFEGLCSYIWQVTTNVYRRCLPLCTPGFPSCSDQGT